ncbi:hypothetical protein LOK49_LG04G01347 [Camellia lanceoleosa]|uniref:Uncharacterized protein n=1 Tax=Camellia lanceoleosa TaxID=1840588 RepID=A0ACC0HV45_9ERIC|nr:hypothetical protein LOK49_LG04G01347 [Camellia lanceoleosa]
MQHPCNECKGTGETINDKDRCPQCKGEKVVQEKKDFNICTSYLAKEKDLAKIQELHSKEVKSSYDSYLKGLTILKGRCYLEEHVVL